MKCAVSVLKENVLFAHVCPHETNNTSASIFYLSKYNDDPDGLPCTVYFTLQCTAHYAARILCAALCYSPF